MVCRCDALLKCVAPLVSVSRQRLSLLTSRCTCCRINVGSSVKVPQSLGVAIVLQPERRRDDEENSAFCPSFYFAPALGGGGRDYGCRLGLERLSLLHRQPDRRPFPRLLLRPRPDRQRLHPPRLYRVAGWPAPLGPHRGGEWAALAGDAPPGACGGHRRHPGLYCGAG